MPDDPYLKRVFVPMRVIVTGGGTGGHVYPALAIIDGLRSRHADWAVLYAGSPRGLEARVAPAKGIPFEPVRARGLAGGWWGRLRALCDLVIGYLQARRLVDRWRPDVVVGTGGYVSAPVVAAAGRRGVPVVLLEQNVTPGKATRWLSRWAAVICCGWPPAAGTLRAEQVLVTGNPVRRDILAATRAAGRAALGIDPDRPVILVTGGSQGARRINEAVLAAAPLWRDRPWTVVHLTGPAHQESAGAATTTALAGGSLVYRPEAYLEDMAGAYAAADVVVCRAGALTLAEVTARGLPAVLVPYPGAGGHQLENAAALAAAGAAVVVPDGEALERLGREVAAVMDDPERRRAMTAASAALGRPDAVDRILDAVEDSMKGRGGAAGD